MAKHKTIIPVRMDYSFVYKVEDYSKEMRDALISFEEKRGSIFLRCNYSDCLKFVTLFFKGKNEN